MDSFSYRLELQNSPFLAAMGSSINVTNRMSAAMAGLAGKSFGGLTTSARVLGDVLFKLPDQMRALQGAVQGLSWPSKLASSAETTGKAFQVLVGNAAQANEAMEQIRQLAAETPFEFPELADSARALVAFGEGSETVAATLRRIGDVAAGTSNRVSELATLYGKARIAGTLYAEDINQLTERGIPVLQEFAKQLGTGVDQVKKLGSEGKINFSLLEKAFMDLTGEGGKFHGMMEAMSTTMDGRMSSLTDSVKALAAAVGKGMNDALKPLAEAATAQFDALGEQAAEVGKAIGYGIDFSVATVQAGNLGEIARLGLEEAGLRFADGLISYSMKAITFIGAGLTDIFLQSAKDLALALQASLGSVAEFLGMDSLKADLRGMDELVANIQSQRQTVADAASDVMTDDRPALFGDQIADRQKRRQMMTAGLARNVEATREERDATEAGEPALPYRVQQEINLIEARGAALEAKMKAEGLNPNPFSEPDWKPAAGAVPDPVPTTGGPSAPSISMGVSPTAADGGGGEAPGPEGGGRRRIRRLSVMENLVSGYNKADKDKRGDWMSFARNRMGGISFDGMSQTARQKLAAADPRRMASMTADPRVSAAGRKALQEAANEGNSAKAAEMIVRYMPEIARHIQRTAQKPSK